MGSRMRADQVALNASSFRLVPGLVTPGPAVGAALGEHRGRLSQPIAEDPGVRPHPQKAAGNRPAPAHAYIAGAKAADDENGELPESGGRNSWSPSSTTTFGVPPLCICGPDHLKPVDVCRKTERDPAMGAELDEMRPPFNALSENKDDVLARMPDGVAPDPRKAETKHDRIRAA